jgi:hypothetical protein
LFSEAKRLIERVCCTGDPDGEVDPDADRLGVALADPDGHGDGDDPGLEEGLPDGLAEGLPAGLLAGHALPLGDDDGLEDGELDALADELADADPLGLGLGSSQSGRSGSMSHGSI